MAQNQFPVSTETTLQQPFPPARSKPQNPLDTLQSMINGVLLEIGKALRSANKKGAKTIAHDNERLLAFIPSAAEKFHMALDELESDIVHAKAVLARDLRVIRMKKYELENPTALEEHNALVDIEEKQTDVLSATEIEPPIQPLFSLPSENNHVEDSVPILDQLSSQADAEAPVKKEATPSAIFSMKEDAVGHNLLDNVSKIEEEGTTGEPQTIKQDESIAGGGSSTELGHALGLDETNTGGSGLPEIPLATDDHGMNFDSMFDSTAGQEDTDLNFDFDFSIGGATSQNDFGTSGGELDLSTFGTNNDGSSLLQGDNTGENSLNALAAAMDSTGQTTADNNMFGEGFTGETNDNDMSAFDEILNGIGLGDGMDDGTGDDVMQHEFDDAFFGLDSTDQT